MVQIKINNKQIEIHLDLVVSKFAAIHASGGGGGGSRNISFKRQPDRTMR